MFMKMHLALIVFGSLTVTLLMLDLPLITILIRLKFFHLNMILIYVHFLLFLRAVLVSVFPLFCLRGSNTAYLQLRLVIRWFLFLFMIPKVSCFLGLLKIF